MGLDVTSSSFLTGFCVLYGIVAILPFLLARSAGGQRDPFNPYLASSILLFLYAFSTVRGFQTGTAAVALANASAPSIAKFALVCLIGQAGLTAGEFIGLSARVTPRPIAARNDEFNLMVLTGPALLLALLALPFYVERFNFLSVASYADTAFASRIARNADVTMGPVDVFLREIPLSVVLCACTVMVFDPRRSGLVRLAAGFALGAYAFTALLAGSRGDLASTALLPVMFYHYRVRRLSPLLVFGVAAGGYLMMNFLEIARLSSDPVEMVQLVANQIGLEGLAFLDVERFGEFQTSLNLVEIINGIDQGQDGFRWGVVLLFNILSTVPRAIWPDRPPTGGELYAEVFHPGALEAGQGFGSFLFQDPYWDFGYAGVFLFGFVLTWSIRRIYGELVINRGTSYSLLLYAILFNFLVIQMIRGGLFAGIKGALVATAPLVLIALLPRVEEAQRESA